MALDRPPSAYVRRLFFDAITHDPEVLEFMCRRVGSRRIMLGSDYPFDMGLEHPVASLEAARLSDDEREDVLCRAAEEFLGLARAGERPSVA